MKRRLLHLAAALTLAATAGLTLSLTQATAQTDTTWGAPTPTDGPATDHAATPLDTTWG